MRRPLRRVRDLGVRRLVIALIALGAVIAASVGGYLASSHTTDNATYFGDVDNPNRVNVTVWITKVDAVTQALSVSVIDIVPSGSLADASGNFAEDTTIGTAAIGNWRADIKAGDSAPDIEQRVTIDGAITDYPFDRYTGRLEVHAVNAAGAELPVALTVVNTDPFFGIRSAPGPYFKSTTTGGVAVDLGIYRSTPTLVFAVFVMVLMLGLAVAAAVASYYVLHWRRGLIFPACSMMAAILFALIPLRNAVPGNPPIGSIIDFGSFFIAEAVISISLISGILMGFRHQLAIERAENSDDESVEQT
ncbi:DUF4436 family protein [Mycobacterium sp. DL592]|uniref:DUF4436 family protein n=1 Tax=Mycobacterium sp. DL592 TaxID=2675524 RepID=UPI001422C8E2|nr:DUF4436 family protein [Mycobacterium sp. DL592]